jgi:hypothetical protein
MKNEAAVYGLKGGSEVMEMSVSYLRTLADRGVVPSFRDDSGKRLFLLQDLLAYKERREKNGGKLKLKLKPKE